MPQGWGDLFRPHNLVQLESDVIPSFLARQRWFARQGSADPEGASVEAHGEIARPAEDGAPSETYLATVVEVGFGAEDRQHYFLPLAQIWSPAETELRQGLAPVTLAELRQFRREGALSTPCRRTVSHWRSWMRSRARRRLPARPRRNPLRQDTELCAGGRAGTANGSPRSASSNRTARCFSTNTGCSSSTAALNPGRTRKSRCRGFWSSAPVLPTRRRRWRRSSSRWTARAGRRQWRSAYCSALSAIRGTAGPRR